MRVFMYNFVDLVSLFLGNFTRGSGSRSCLVINAGCLASYRRLYRTKWDLWVQFVYSSGTEFKSV